MDATTCVTMELLNMPKYLLGLIILLPIAYCWSVPDDGLLYDKITDPRFCNSADEFKNSYLFLVKQSDLSFTEPQAVRDRKSVV